MGSPKIPRTGPIEYALRELALNRTQPLHLDYGGKAKQIKQAHVRRKWQKAAEALAKRLP